MTQAAPRRIVTGLVDGKSGILSDGPSPNFHQYVGIPGFSSAVLWSTPSNASTKQPEKEPAPPSVQVLPAPGETCLMVVTFPPDAVFAGPQFKPALAYEEQKVHIPGLVDTFEAADPAMHRTVSIDYDVVLEGEIWLELDDGVTAHLRQGDIVIQGAVRHAWRKKGSAPAKMLFVLMGASEQR